MSKIFANDKIRECKKEIKDLKDMLKINPQFSNSTVYSIMLDIENLNKEIKRYQKSIELI